MPAHSSETDSHLITLLRNGDEEAFVEIYRRHWRKLYNAAYKRLKNADVCEDLVQNVFMDLWERRESVSILNLEAYLITAVKFQVIKISTSSRSKNHFIDLLETTLTSSFSTDYPLIEHELSELLRLWMAALPEKRRKIFIMHYMEGIDPLHIAEILGLSQKTVQNQLSIASGALKSQLLRVFLLIITSDPIAFI